MVATLVEQISRTKLSRFIRGGLMLAVVILVWFAFYSFAQYNRAVENETKIFSGASSSIIQSTVFHLKDLAVVLSGGTDPRFTDIAEVSSENSFVHGLGYLDPSDFRPIWLAGRNYLQKSSLAQRENLAGRLLRDEGSVLNAQTVGYRSLFEGLQDDEVVLLQAIRAANVARPIVTYLVIDLEEIFQSVSNDLQNVSILSAQFVFAPTGIMGQPRIRHVDFESQYGFLGDFHWFLEGTPVKVSGDLWVQPWLEHDLKAFGVLVGVFAALVGMGVVLTVLLQIYNRSLKITATSMAQALRHAEAANDAKSTFLANMSHEIRTPLNGVFGMAELLMRTDLDDSQRRYVSQVKSSGTTLLNILNDVLDISKLESGQLVIDPHPTELQTLLYDVMAFYGPVAFQKGLLIILDVDPEVPIKAELDSTRVRQVLGNLIMNAIKFTEQGSITVRAGGHYSGPDKREFVLQLAVEDTGVGISDQKIAGLFSRFVQESGDTTRLYGGTGLGLAICKQICDLMGASIGVVSEPGKGSTFSISQHVPVIEHAHSLRSHGGIHVGVMVKHDKIFEMTRKALVNANIHVTRVPRDNKAVEHVLDLQMSGVQLDGVIVSEEGDFDTARLIGKELTANEATRNMWCILTARSSDNPSFSHFDQVLIVPIMPSVLVGAVMQLAGELRANRSGAPIRQQKQAQQYSEDFQLDVLLVDDNKVNLLFAEELLEGMGCSVVTAINGREAIERAEETQFDVILLDCQMPVMDGYQAAGELSKRMANGKMKETPIIALTANALKGDREKCIEAGMDDFLSKPMQIEALQAMLGRLSNQKKLRAQRYRETSNSSADDEWAQALQERSAAPAQRQEIEAPRALRPVLARAQKASEALQNVALRPKPAPGVAETKKADPVMAVPQAVPQAPSASPEPVASVPAEGKPAPAPAAKGKIPLIDAAVFEANRAAMSKFDTLLEFYLSDTEEYLAAIKSNLLSGDISETVLPSHTIKSSSRIVGAEALATLAENFEKRARQDDGDQAGVLEELHPHMERVFALTRERLLKLQAGHRQAGAA